MKSIAGWTLALGLGVLSLSSAEAAALRPLDGPPDHNVSSLAWDGEALWIGYFDAGLARLDDGRWEEIVIEGRPQSRWINSLCWDGPLGGDREGKHSASLWVGSNGGLARWDPSLRELTKVEAIDGAVQSVRADSGVLVVAGSDRVWIESGDGWEVIELPGEALHTAFVHDGTLWAAGMWGVLERRGDKWQRYSELNGRLPHSWVTSLSIVGGKVWAGTYDAGLVALEGEAPARLVRRGAWVNFNALAGVDGGIAVGTMGDGLLLWDAESRSWNRLTTAAGLPSDDVTAIVDTPERLWVGTRGGLVALPWSGR